MAENEFAGPCGSCGEWVEKKMGVRIGSRGEGWTVYHKCAHPLHALRIDVAMITRAINASEAAIGKSGDDPTTTERMEAALRAALKPA